MLNLDTSGNHALCENGFAVVRDVRTRANGVSQPISLTAIVHRTFSPCILEISLTWNRNVRCRKHFVAPTERLGAQRRTTPARRERALVRRKGRVSTLPYKRGAKRLPMRCLSRGMYSQCTRRIRSCSQKACDEQRGRVAASNRVTETQTTQPALSRTSSLPPPTSSFSSTVLPSRTAPNLHRISSFTFSTRHSFELPLWPASSAAPSRGAEHQIHLHLKSESRKDCGEHQQTIHTLHPEWRHASESRRDGADDAQPLAGRRPRSGCRCLLSPARRGRRWIDHHRGDCAESPGSKKYARRPTHVW